MNFNDECRVWFQCPKCGMMFERYGKTLNEIEFGTCMGCGYEEKKKCDAKLDDKIQKEQITLRKIGLTLLILGLIFFPIACIIHYMLLGISGILVATGALMTIRSYVHIKYSKNNK